MAKGRLQHVTAKFRAQLLAHEAQAEHQLDQAYKHVLATIQPEINRLLKEIGAMQAAGQDIPVSWLYQKNRLGNIKRFIEEHINHFGNISQAEVEQLQRLGVDLGSKNAQQMLDATLPEGVNYLFNRPNAGAIQSIIGATQAGSPLADLFNGFGQEAAQGAGQALVRGITLGYGPAKVARDLQQVLDVPRWRALTISRTELLRAYNGAALENYRQNSNVVQGWQWLASLGSACIACTEMNGSFHTLDEDMASHVRCRCTMVPVTASYSEILGVDVGDSGGMDIPDGASWFADQSESTQLSLLGPTRYQYYQDGMSLSDMVGTKHDPAWGSSVYIKPIKDLAKAR